MNRSVRLLAIAVVVTSLCLSPLSVGRCQDAVRAVQPEVPAEPGDRITCDSAQAEEPDATALVGDSYALGPGDSLAIHLSGRSMIDYKVRPDAESEDPNVVPVSPAGDIYLPIVGSLHVVGKTLPEVESMLRSALGKYFKNFDLSVSLAKARTLYVWVGGEVRNSGPRALPAVATSSYAVLRAGIRPTGSTRRVELIRGGAKQVLDLYNMAVLGDAQADIGLLSGDSIYVPPVNHYVEVSGEVVRPGRYEMVTPAGGSKGFRVRDLLELSLGTLPTAALDRAFVERIGGDGRKVAVSVDIRAQGDASAGDTVLHSGDRLVVPSISAFQPMVLLVGEFMGEGVYQRTPGTTQVDIENKSGIYPLKQGQTVLDMITATGGVTPQADLRRARIEREESGAVRTIPVDLDRLLVRGDKSADVLLANGDTLILPAIADKIHIFGEVKTPGSYTYSPNRRLVDYLGNAGGPTPKAKLTEVRVVRGTVDSPIVLKLNAKRAIKGASLDGNPVLEPGDIVYVPGKFISDWRDAVQLVFTGLSLESLLRRR